MSALKGRVVRVTLRRFKDGSIEHATRVVFDHDVFKAVTIRGELPQTELRRHLLEALESRYEIVGDLPDPHWHRSSASVLVAAPEQTP